MGKASSSKKVARAAGASGGRTSRGRAPVLWYSALLAIVVAGAGLTAFSRQERQDALGDPKSQTQPRSNQDHWHVAYGVYVCDKWLDPVTDQSDAAGIHTHGDGVIHAHPFQSKVAGTKATFDKFTTQIKAKVDNKSISWPAPGGKVSKSNGDKCGDATGQVKVFYDGKPIEGTPNGVRFTDRGKLVVAFVGADVTAETIGDPPSVPNLDNLNDLAPSEPQGSAPSDPAPGAPPSETPPGGVPSDSTVPTTPPTTAPPASAAP